MQKEFFENINQNIPFGVYLLANFHYLAFYVGTGMFSTQIEEAKIAKHGDWSATLNCGPETNVDLGRADEIMHMHAFVHTCTCKDTFSMKRLYNCTCSRAAYD